MKTKQIVLLENAESVLAMIEELLVDEGYHVISSTHEIPIRGMHPLPDVILLDHWLGGRPGTEICQELKRNPKTAPIPVVLTSTDDKIKDIAASCQADGYISKPFEIQDLLNQVKRFV